LLIKQDEAGEIVNALEAFGEAWFPNSDGFSVPPKLSSALALFAVLYGAVTPRVAALRALSKQREAQATEKTNVEQPDVNELLFRPIG
jgi:hypothetical protein